MTSVRQLYIEKRAHPMFNWHHLEVESDNPNFIMLDEAFSALDSDLKVSIYEEVLEIFQGKNITVILVTHDAEEAKILSTRQLNMDNGELV